MTIDLEAARNAAREARERADKATAGPWKVWIMSVMADHDGTSNVDTAVLIANTVYKDEQGRPRTNNAEFIAAARADVPALAALVEEMAAEVEWLRPVAIAAERMSDAQDHWALNALHLAVSDYRSAKDRT